MFSFNVLHLSDLHISKLEDPSAHRLRESLINDIHKMTIKHNMQIDVVAMTGDTVDKGGSPEAFKLAKEFYEELLKKINLSKDKLLIVPGNHDIPRREAIRLLIQNGSKEDFLDEKRFEENWETLETRFGSYYKFVNDVNGIGRPATEYLGSDLKIIKTDKGTMKFLLLNSSWACTGESDYEKIMIGRWQLERLKKIKESSIRTDVTIALLHHPLDWFEKNDKKFIVDYLTNENCLPADILLHGHIHDGNITSFMNPDKRITSFVTGIGYPEQTKDILSRTKVGNCRYSVYKINSNDVEVILRVSNDNGVFVADTKLYNEGSESGVLKYEYKRPIFIHSDAASKEVIESKKTIEVDSVKIVHEWVGREHELELINKFKMSVLSIAGMGGQGKSALASEILRKYSRGENALYELGIWIDCRELKHSLHYKIIQSLEKISEGKETALLFKDERIEDTVKRFITHLQKRRLLIVFDNIDAYVRADIEGPTVELKPFLESLLELEHSSLVILTSRNPLTHESAAFYPIKLNGLSKEEGLAFFEKRKIDVSGKNKEQCEEIIKLTHGHPWWLGLIAGQLRNNRQTLKDSINKLRTGYGNERELINQQNYFNNVWAQLNKDRQKILRSLVEVHRPLTEFEIASFGKGGPPKIKQELNRLERLGLVEPHEALKDEISYQVHPLLREFVHGIYSLKEQQSYVQKVLYIFLPRKLVDALFVDYYSLGATEEMKPVDLMDSIETCLLSRNIERALGLLEQYKDVLIDKGYHHQFESLACRILDEINWEENNIFNRINGVRVLSSIIQQLSYMGEHQQAYYYLKKYESAVEPNTVAYLDFLEIAAENGWRDAQFKQAIDYTNEYEVLAEKLQTTRNISKVKHTRALAFRDSGEKVSEALKLFDSMDVEESSHSLTGNKARCYYVLKDYSKAEELLKKSLLMLLSETSYNAQSNLGFAYLWLVELMYDQGKFKESKAYINLVQDVWLEYAPGLISKVELIKDKYNLNSKWNDIEVSLDEAKKIESDFLNLEGLSI